MVARSSFKPPNLAFPADGTMAISAALDFQLGTTCDVDLSGEMEAGKLSLIQTIYIDNADNPAPLDLMFYGAPIPQRVRALPYSQGYYPVSWPVGSARFRGITGAGQTVNVILFNAAFPYFTWKPADGVLVVPPLTNGAVGPLALGAGDNVLIAGNAGQTIKFYRAVLSVDAPSILKFTNGLGGALLFAATLTAGGSLTLQPSGISWFAAGSGVPLVVNSSAAINLYGGFGYVQS